MVTHNITFNKHNVNNTNYEKTSYELNQERNISHNQGLISYNRDDYANLQEGQRKNSIIQYNQGTWDWPISDYSQTHKVKVKVVTNQDNQEHTYFHSFSLDAQVTDFMHTCELRCPFHWDLMEYWEPIRQSCVVYGANQGDYKVLFIGRVRELSQDGYELSIILQNFGWKFKQDVPQELAEQNMLGHHAYDIMCVIFNVLKIESPFVSESAKARLKQVGLDLDGNLVNNAEVIEEMPDLFERLKESDPSKLVNKGTLDRKVGEKEVLNIEDINYTLKYEEQRETLKNIVSLGGTGFTPGKQIYQQGWASNNSGATANFSSSARQELAQAGIDENEALQAFKQGKTHAHTTIETDRKTGKQTRKTTWS